MEKLFELSRLAWMGTLVAFAVSAAGCNQASENKSTGGDSEVSAQKDAQPDADGHDHSGWWCVEHGIPEEVCSMCSSKAAAKFKEQGDWCEKHNRAASQCFQCDPALAEKFSKLYEAKYGHKPPEPKE